MLCKRIIVLLGFLQVNSVLSLWSCSTDTDCSTLGGSVCRGGDCVCPPGQQSVLGGTLCADAAPYHTSPCVEDHQCSNLVTAFSCRRLANETEGQCFCQPGFHYFLGRCWQAQEYGAACTRDEECLGPIRDPYSLRCDGVCTCGTGYYSRQRGECRRIARAVGEGCVLNEDCQFENGLCDINTFTCYESTAENTTVSNPQPFEAAVSMSVRATRQHGADCGVTPCPDPFICSSFGGCVCPTGYYASDDGSVCLAELGSPATEDQCVGLFAEVRDGVCTCQPNFFFEETMRDCVKVSRRLSDSCVSDISCHTFGVASRCGPPREPWGFRNCECDAELAVWDEGRQMCRLFAGIGESCEVDSDCMAGELEIQCIIEDGQGTCACPQGLVEVEGLCLTTGLELGDPCQASQECTETPNMACLAGRCSCGDGYRETEDSCSPTIGGVCELDSDCVIENTVCVSSAVNDNSSTCQCGAEFVDYDDECWPSVAGYESVCNVTAQCTAVLGEDSRCEENRCLCEQSTHYRDGGCWTMIGLFETCTRTSECFLRDISERVVCRNSLCQCHFEFPYSEELHTCSSSAETLISRLVVVIVAFLFVISS